MPYRQLTLPWPSSSRILFFHALLAAVTTYAAAVLAQSPCPNGAPAIIYDVRTLLLDDNWPQGDWIESFTTSGTDVSWHRTWPSNEENAERRLTTDGRVIANQLQIQDRCEAHWTTPHFYIYGVGVYHDVYIYARSPSPVAYSVSVHGTGGITTQNNGIWGVRAAWTEPVNRDTQLNTQPSIDIPFDDTRVYEGTASGTIREFPEYPGVAYRPIYHHYWNSRATTWEDYFHAGEYGHALSEGTVTYEAFLNIGQDPVSSIAGPPYLHYGEPGQFSGLGAHDPDGGPLQYQWSADGPATIDNAQEPVCSIVWRGQGRFDVRLTVTDCDGRSDTSVYSVYVDAECDGNIFATFDPCTSRNCGQTFAHCWLPRGIATKYSRPFTLTTLFSGVCECCEFRQYEFTTGAAKEDDITYPNGLLCRYGHRSDPPGGLPTPNVHTPDVCYSDCPRRTECPTSQYSGDGCVFSMYDAPGITDVNNHPSRLRLKLRWQIWNTCLDKEVRHEDWWITCDGVHDGNAATACTAVRADSVGNDFEKSINYLPALPFVSTTVDLGGVAWPLEAWLVRPGSIVDPELSIFDHYQLALGMSLRSPLPDEITTVPVIRVPGMVLEDSSVVIWDRPEVMRFLYRFELPYTMPQTQVTANISLGSQRVAVPIDLPWCGLVSDFNECQVKHTFPPPGDGGHNGWYAISNGGFGFGEIQDGIVVTGNALHEHVPWVTPQGVEVADGHAVACTDLNSKPYISISADFYAHRSSFQLRANEYAARLVARGEASPVKDIVLVWIGGGDGAHPQSDGLRLGLLAYDGTSSNVAIPLSVGQHLAWDQWHHVDVTINHPGDRYVNVVVDGETQDLGLFRPPRTRLPSGAMVRGQRIDELRASITSGTKDQNHDDPEDDIYWDNIVLRTSNYPTGVAEPSAPVIAAESLGLDVTSAVGSAAAQFSCRVPVTSVCSVRVYNLRGELIRTIHDGELPAGEHLLSWDGRNSRGSRVSAGMYLVKLVSGRESASAKVLRIN